MGAYEETIDSIKGRLKVLEKGMVSEKNSVQFYQTLMEKTPADSEEGVGMRSMYEELMNEEKKHVEKFETLTRLWKGKLKEMEHE